MYDARPRNEHLRNAHQAVADALTKLDIAASWMQTNEVWGEMPHTTAAAGRMIGSSRENLERLAKMIRAAIRE